MFRLALVLLTAGAFAALTAIPVAAADATTAAWQRLRVLSTETLNALAHTALAAAADEAKPAIELQFERFFGVVGDEGLRFTDYLASLSGQRVRVTGFMVREAQRQRGVFLLVQRPDVVQSAGQCVAPHLPPAIVHVHAPESSGSALVPYVPGRLTISGTLEIGARAEANGRNSWVRILLDRVPSFVPPSDAPLETASQP